MSGYAFQKDNVVMPKRFCDGGTACSEEVVCTSMVNLALALNTRLKITVEVEDVECKGIKCASCD